VLVRRARAREFCISRGQRDGTNQLPKHRALFSAPKSYRSSTSTMPVNFGVWVKGDPSPKNRHVPKKQARCLCYNARTPVVPAAAQKYHRLPACIRGPRQRGRQARCLCYNARAPVVRAAAQSTIGFQPVSVAQGNGTRGSASPLTLTLSLTPPYFSSAACAAARRATGTLNGLQLT